MQADKRGDWASSTLRAAKEVDEVRNAAFIQRNGRPACRAAHRQASAAAHTAADAAGPVRDARLRAPTRASDDTCAERDARRRWRPRDQRGRRRVRRMTAHARDCTVHAGALAMRGGSRRGVGR
jgi:hypothetical protein